MFQARRDLHLEKKTIAQAHHSSQIQISIAIWLNVVLTLISTIDDVNFQGVVLEASGSTCRVHSDIESLVLLLLAGVGVSSSIER